MEEKEILLEMLDIATKILAENEHCRLCAFSGTPDCHACSDCQLGIFNGLEFEARRNIRKCLDELGNRKVS